MPDRYARRAIALTAGLWLFVGLIYLPILVERHPDDGWRSIALDFSTVFVSMLIALPLYLVFRRTMERRTWVRALAISATVAACAIVQAIFDFQFTGWVASRFEASWAVLPRDPTRFYGAMFNYVCVFGVNVALFNVSAARLRAAEQQAALAEARSAAQLAQLAALRLQLNPHFLFNTLNAISAMIVTRRNAEAEAMTGKLCAFLRASLATDPAALVPLDEELRIVDDYLDIEIVRFGARLIVAVDCDDDAAAVPVPALILQPLVENAVKYGVSRSRGAVTIAIAARIEDRSLIVTVDDDGRADPDAGPHAGTGTGLANVRRRLEALYGSRASLLAGGHAGGYRAIVTLPVA